MPTDNCEKVFDEIHVANASKSGNARSVVAVSDDVVKRNVGMVSGRMVDCSEAKEASEMLFSGMVPSGQGQGEVEAAKVTPYHKLSLAIAKSLTPPHKLFSCNRKRSASAGDTSTLRTPRQRVPTVHQPDRLSSHLMTAKRLLTGSQFGTSHDINVSSQELLKNGEAGKLTLPPAATTVGTSGKNRASSIADAPPAHPSIPGCELVTQSRSSEFRWPSADAVANNVTNQTRASSVVESLWRQYLQGGGGVGVNNNVNNNNSSATTSFYSSVISNNDSDAICIGQQGQPRLRSLKAYNRSNQYLDNCDTFVNNFNNTFAKNQGPEFEEVGSQSLQRVFPKNISYFCDRMPSSSGSSDSHFVNVDKGTVVNLNSQLLHSRSNQDTTFRLQPLYPYVRGLDDEALVPRDTSLALAEAELYSSNSHSDLDNDLDEGYELDSGKKLAVTFKSHHSKQPSIWRPF